MIPYITCHNIQSCLLLLDEMKSALVFMQSYGLWWETKETMMFKISFSLWQLKGGISAMCHFPWCGGRRRWVDLSIKGDILTLDNSHFKGRWQGAAHSSPFLLPIFKIRGWLGERSFCSNLNSFWGSVKIAASQMDWIGGKKCETWLTSVNWLWRWFGDGT